MAAQNLSTPCSGWPAANGLFQLVSRQSGPGSNWRKNMLRKSLLAIAASFMTLSTFGGTLAIMSGGSPVTTQVA
jgi:hypothetical protein